MTDPDFAGRPPYTRPWFIAAAAVVALILVGGVVVALLPPPETDPAGPPPRGAGTSPAEPVAPPSGDPLATTLPTVAPDDVTWHLVGQTAVPVSRSAGPSRTTDDTAAGFARTPTGALIAAAQLNVRAGYSAGRAAWEPTIEEQFVAGPDRDRLLAALRAAGDAAAAPGELSQLAGYLYQSYTPDTAVIGLVYRAPTAGTPTYHILTVTLRWLDGDWRMLAPPGGSWTSLNRAATDLTGVVEWGAR